MLYSLKCYFCDLIVLKCGYLMKKLFPLMMKAFWHKSLSSAKNKGSIQTTMPPRWRQVHTLSIGAAMCNNVVFIHSVLNSLSFPKLYFKVSKYYFTFIIHWYGWWQLNKNRTTRGRKSATTRGAGHTLAPPTVIRSYSWNSPEDSISPPEDSTSLNLPSTKHFIDHPIL
jgi:hypothetical protein